MLGWIYLILAIALETAGTMCVKLSEHFTHLLPSISIFVFYGISFVVFLPLSYKIDEEFLHNKNKALLIMQKKLKVNFLPNFSFTKTL